MTAHLIRGDARMLPLATDLQVDAIVTDPPSGTGFMGKTWDHDHGGRDGWVRAFTTIFETCYRLLKPGGHAFVWALPRTSHWTAIALEDAGFEIRDVVVHLFGSGFPKSLDVSKAIDKAAGVERDAIGPLPLKATPGPARTMGRPEGAQRGWQDHPMLTAPATLDAARWSGWGTALKPASEHWILCRKPLSEPTIAANVLAHGVGGLNVDGCRISAAAGDYAHPGNDLGQRDDETNWRIQKRQVEPHPAGRWPANVTLDEEAAVMLDAQSGTLTSGANPTRRGSPKFRNAYGEFLGQEACDAARGLDTGGASRFFYQAKPSTSERNAGLPPGTVNDHPTVKSIALMRWLCRLITPPGGTVLDCFMGSGTTGCAAVLEGFNFVGIEQDAHYIDLARRRITYRAAQGRQADMFAEVPA